MINYTFFLSNVLKKLSKSIPPFLCCPMSQDRPLRTPKRRHQACRFTSSGTEIQDPFANMQSICSLRAMSNSQGPAAEGVTHKIFLQQRPFTRLMISYNTCTPWHKDTACLEATRRFDLGDCCRLFVRLFAVRFGRPRCQQNTEATHVLILS